MLICRNFVTAQWQQYRSVPPGALDAYCAKVFQLPGQQSGQKSQLEEILENEEGRDFVTLLVKLIREDKSMSTRESCSLTQKISFRSLHRAWIGFFEQAASSPNLHYNSKSWLSNSGKAFKYLPRLLSLACVESDWQLVGLLLSVIPGDEIGAARQTILPFKDTLPDTAVTVIGFLERTLPQSPYQQPFHPHAASQRSDHL